MTEITVKTSDFVSLNVSNSSRPESVCAERRFQKNLTILEFKMKLELVTGGSSQTMRLELYDINNKLVCEMSDNEAMLGSYPVEDGMRVHVVDKFLMLYDFSDTSKVEKFNLPDEEYNKKPDTVRAFLQKNKLGKYNEDKMKELQRQQQEEEMKEKTLSSMIPIEARCEVRVPNQPCRRATVMYNGTLKDASKGIWIGVQYDEPLGKNDGSVDGKRYFTCPPNYGGFVKPVHVTIGNFPVENFLDDEI